MPAYNAEKYLEEAIASVISQSDPDWELILVDDGSTDATATICDRAATLDSRISVIHTPNRGVSAARNTGINAAKGEFIGFLDADDILFPDFLKSLHDSLSVSGVKMAAALFTDKKKLITKDQEVGKLFQTLSQEEILHHLLYQTSIEGLGQILDTSICNKIYHRSLWRTLRFKEGRRYEDLDIFYKILLSAEKLVFVPRPLYFYRRNPQSFIHKYDISRLDALEVTDKMVENLSRLEGYEDMYKSKNNLILAARTRRFAAHFNILLLLVRNGRPDHKAETRCLNVIRKERGMVLRNRNARFKDRIGALMAYCLL